MRRLLMTYICCIAIEINVLPQSYTDESYDISSLLLLNYSWYSETNGSFYFDGLLSDLEIMAIVSKTSDEALNYSFFYSIYDVIVNAEAGEIFISNLYDDIKNLSYTMNHDQFILSTSTGSRISDEIEISDNTSLFQIQVDDYIRIERDIIITGSIANDAWTETEFNEHATYNDDFNAYRLDDELISRFPEDYYYYRWAIQKFGKITSFTLQPVDDVTYPTLDDYFATKNFSSISSSDYIISQLSSDIECVAIDTYGQRIYLLCPALTWSVDIDAGTATYTPYFTPRNYDTDWILDNSIECSFSSSANETTKSLLLWNSNAISNTTADKFTTIGGQNSITITNNPGVEIYNIAGRLIYKGTDAIVNVPQGIYVVVAGEQTEKVIVK